MNDTKDRMIQAAAETMRRRGVAGSSFTEVLSQSGAPRGVIYHHFPGGKDELTQAAVRWTGETVAGYLAALTPAEPTPEGVAQAFYAMVRPIVLESVGGAGCAVAAAVAEGAPGSGLLLVTRDALRSWRAALAGHLAAAGLDPTAATDRAALLIATLEGAHVLCRAEGSIEPFDALAGATAALFCA